MSQLQEMLNVAESLSRDRFSRQMSDQEHAIKDAMQRYGCGVEDLCMVYQRGAFGSWKVKHVPGRAWADWHSSNHGWDRFNSTNPNL